MITVDDVKFYYKARLWKRFRRDDEKFIFANRFRLEKGDTMALVGLNGSGKSTFFKLLIGILKPEEGKIVVDGMDPWKDRKELVKNIGVVWGQRSTLWWDLPVFESFEALKDIYKIPKDDHERRLNDFVTSFDCQEYLSRPLRKLSLGQRVKVDIIAALLHNPKILFLDEPFIGLDFKSKKVIIEKLNELIKKNHITCLLTSHNMEDIDILCDKITMIDGGKLITTISKKELLNYCAGQSKIEIKKMDEKDLIVSNDRKVLREINYSMEKSSVEILVVGDDKNRSEVISEIFKNNHSITSLVVNNNGLQDAIEKMIKSSR